jgi:hypothetical protein
MAFRESLVEVRKCSMHLFEFSKTNLVERGILLCHSVVYTPRFCMLDQCELGSSQGIVSSYSLVVEHYVFLDSLARISNHVDLTDGLNLAWN